MSEHANPIQRQRLLAYMQIHDGITQYEALERLSILRLASRISELKKLGYPVKSERITVMNRYGEKCRVARYYLEDEKE